MRLLREWRRHAIDPLREKHWIREKHQECSLIRKCRNCLARFLRVQLIDALLKHIGEERKRMRQAHFREYNG